MGEKRWEVVLMEVVGLGWALHPSGKRYEMGTNAGRFVEISS